MTGYIIKRNDNGLYCRWDENIIVFENMAEVELFIHTFPSFFDGMGITIEPNPFDDGNLIKFTDINTVTIE